MVLSPSPSGAPAWSRTPPPPYQWKGDADALDAAIRAVEHPEEIPDKALAWASFPYFLTQLRDDKAQPLLVPWHIEDWALLMQNERLLALLAARDHGKTWTAWAYILWRCWRHNRAPDGTLLMYVDGDGQTVLPEGEFEFIYVTYVKPIAIERFDSIKGMMLNNTHLFGDVLPQREPGAALATLKDSWAKTEFRLRNGVKGAPRSIGSATRGLHPDLVVADDIVDPKNSGTDLQRNRVWAYVVSTLLPMVGKTGQMIVLGTPQHKTDALFRLKGKPNWHWARYRAVDWEANDGKGLALWPERYTVADLRDIQKTDVLLFSREYQMDPRDDASSLFPHALTEKAFRRDLTWQPRFKPNMFSTGDYVVLGEDLAISESTGADYTVSLIVLYNRVTQKRRLLFVKRERGLTFRQQVTLLRTLCPLMTVSIGVVEQNGFQKWLKQELEQYPETNTRIFGHNTGVEKQTLLEGIPAIKLVLEADLWEIPYPDGSIPGVPEDPEAVAFAEAWQDELNAFGWSEGKLQGIGEHDDIVMAMWFVERAIRMIEALQGQDEVVTSEDVGIEHVAIGSAY